MSSLQKKSNKLENKVGILTLLICAIGIVLIVLGFCFSSIVGTNDNSSGSNGGDNSYNGNTPSNDNTNTHIHQYETSIIAPTCDSQGYTTYTCSCGDNYIDDYIKKVAHTPATAVIENEIIPNCMHGGSYDKVVYCSVCEEKISSTHFDTEIADHNIVNGVCDGCNGKYPILTYVVSSSTYMVSGVDDAIKNTTTIIIPETYNGKKVTCIGSRAFYGCNNLASIIIPDSVDTIGEKAFENCSSIKTAILPTSVTCFEREAFKNCSSMKIYYKGTEAEWDNIMINYGAFFGTIASTSGYQSFRYFYSETEPELNAGGTAYNGSYWHYDNNGEIVIWKKEN